MIGRQRDRAEDARGPRLDARKVEQVVHDPGEARRLRADPRSQAGHNVGVFFAVECFCQEAERPEGRFQLVAEVGDEVAAHGFQPAQLGDVVNQGDGAGGRVASPRGYALISRVCLVGEYRSSVSSWYDPARAPDPAQLRSPFRPESHRRGR